MQKRLSEFPPLPMLSLSSLCKCQHHFSFLKSKPSLCWRKMSVNLALNHFLFYFAVFCPLHLVLFPIHHFGTIFNFVRVHFP